MFRSCFTSFCNHFCRRGGGGGGIIVLCFETNTPSSSPQRHRMYIIFVAGSVYTYNCVTIYFFICKQLLSYQTSLSMLTLILLIIVVVVGLLSRSRDSVASTAVAQPSFFFGRTQLGFWAFT